MMDGQHAQRSAWPDYGPSSNTGSGPEWDSNFPGINISKQFAV